MKVFAPVLFLVFSLAFIACSKIEESNNLTEQQTENPRIDKPNSKPILEIMQDEEGMWNVTGKTLFFNLYDNGIVEFEYPDDTKKIAGKTNKAEEINSLKRIKISEDELRKFTDLLNAEDFKKTKNNYKNKCCCTDATVDYKINFNDVGNPKSIILNSYCGLENLTNPQKYDISDFPKVLSDLMILVDNIRYKYISK